MDPASTTRHIAVSGHHLAYHRAGGGAAVLMLHGITTYSFIIVRGDADVCLSPDITARLHGEIPGSRLIRLPTGGHLIQLDLPGLLAETILAFRKTPRNPHGARAMDVEVIRVVRSESPELED